MIADDTSHLNFYKEEKQRKHSFYNSLIRHYLYYFRIRDFKIDS